MKDWKKRHRRTPLFDALKRYLDERVIPFDVPGHKHGRGLKEFTDFVGKTIMNLDVNAMEDLDNICNPIGVIKEAEKLAAEAYNATHAYFLVNGTTFGVQAMIMSVCKPNDKIIIPRNAHKSTIGGIILSGAIPVYVQPEINEELGIAMGVPVANIRKAIKEHPDAKAVFVINPTYYGVASDLKSIIRLAHKNDMLVLVDEAHGAHMRFHPELPKMGMDLGADMSAVSTHKTGGSLTQSSLLLINDLRVDPLLVKSVLNLTQTTSASYLLMASIDVARKQLVLEGRKLLDNTLNLVRYAREEINQVPGLYAFGKELLGTPGCFAFDETKFSVNVKALGISGYEVQKILRRDYHIQVELADLYNIMAIFSLGDSEETVMPLINALKEIARRFGVVDVRPKTFIPETPEVIVSPRDAYYSSKKVVRLEEADGEISGEMIMAYPPGIPVVSLGERITQDIIDYVKLLKEEGCQLQGTEDPYVDYIKVLGH